MRFNRKIFDKLHNGTSALNVSLEFSNLKMLRSRVRLILFLKIIAYYMREFEMNMTT